MTCGLFTGMSSAEPSRTSVYGADIAIRVVWQRLGMGLSFRSIAKRLQIGLGSTYRLYNRFVQTGKFTPVKTRRSARSHTRKLDELHEIFIIGLLMDNPGLYLHEMQIKIKETVSGATICRVLQRNGYTRKKIIQVARQRCIELRGAFMAQMLMYPREFLVWLDETGSDNRDQIRRFGYAMSGLTPVYHRFLNRGTRLSTIAAMSSDGLLTYEILSATTNGEKFFDFVRGYLIPNMQPFPAPGSILIMDNCSIHHVDEVQEILHRAGILVIYLPPYSPDLNPAEEMFSFVKYYLKDHDDILQCTNDSIDIIKSAFDSVTVDQCSNWIIYSGYN